MSGSAYEQEDPFGEIPEHSAATARPDAAAKRSKAERALDLAQSRYTLRRDHRPYLLHGGSQFRFSPQGRKTMRADLRYAWREKYPDEGAPSNADLNRVCDDLERLAMDADPDAIEQGLETSDNSPDIPADGGVEDGGIGLVVRTDGCPLPDGYKVPDDYVAGADGSIWYLSGRWGPSRCSWAWLFPVAIYIDPDGAQWVELAWRDHFRWVSRLVRMSISKSGRKLVAETGDAGIPVTDSEARDAEKWLAATLMANKSAIPRHPVARQLGWQKDGLTFVTGSDSPWRVEPRYPDQVDALAAHGPRGTMAGWQEAISRAGNYPIVQLGIYESLAAALLEVLSLDSFSVDHWGKSSRGKTITAQAGLSCWADPSEKGDGLFSWRTKMIGVEKRLNLVNGLPVVIDETRVATSPDLIDAVIYQIPKNHGQARGGGWPNMIPWRTIAIITGEQAATSFTTHQGANARVLSTSQAPFGSEGERSREAAEAIKKGIEDNYGIAGPAFVARLQAKLAADGGAADLRKRHAAWTGKLRGETDMSGRRAPLMAAIALAAELAAEWKITPFKVPGPDDFLAMYSSADDPRDNRPEMALDIVREFLAAHHDKMYGCGDGEHPPGAGWIGHDAKEGPALLPEKLREELKRRNYDLDAVLPGWLEMGALVIMPSQRPSYLIPRRTAGRQTKHLIFQREIIYPEAGQDADQ